MDLADVRRLGEALLAEHGPAGWTFALDHAKRRAGLCRYDKKTISVSRHLMALYDEPRVRDTILHEIAHALVGHEHGHDVVWKRTAEALGCSGERLVDVEAPKLPAPWQGTCPAGHTYERHRRPTRAASCTRCDRAFNPAHLLSWTYRGTPVEPIVVTPAPRRRSVRRRINARGGR